MRWACPDLGSPKPHGFTLPVPGSDYEFPDCPVAYLRPAAEVKRLRSKGVRASDEHLLGGIHPAELVGDTVYALRQGSMSLAECSPLMRDLALLMMRESDAADEHQREQHRKEREASNGAR